MIEPQDRPLLSVLTPVRDAAHLLDRCAGSVLTLGRRDIEHIIVDGGSRDDTPDVGEALAARHPGRVRFVRIPDRSMTEGLVHAAQLSRGRYLGPLNADDRYLPGLTCALEVMATESPAVLLANCRIVRDDGTFKYITRPWLPNSLAAWHLFGCMTPECGCFISRSSYEFVGGYRTAFRFAQDYDLLLRLVRRATVKYLDVEVGEFLSSRFSLGGLHGAEMVREFAQINAFGAVGAWLQLRRLDKLGRTIIGMQRYRWPPRKRVAREC